MQVVLIRHTQLLRSENVHSCDQQTQINDIPIISTNDLVRNMAAFHVEFQLA